MKVKYRFRWNIFIVSFFITGLLTFLSFIFVAAKDDGTGSGSFISDVMIVLFGLLRFPAHNIMVHFGVFRNNLFLAGLFFNCLLYSVLIERVLAILKK